MSLFLPVTSLRLYTWKLERVCCASCKQHARLSTLHRCCRCCCCSPSLLHLSLQTLKSWGTLSIICVWRLHRWRCIVNVIYAYPSKAWSFKTVLSLNKLHTRAPHYISCFFQYHVIMQICSSTTQNKWASFPGNFVL